MNLEPHRIVSGLLLEYPGGAIGRQDIEQADLEFIDVIADTRWEEFVLESSEPLAGEIPVGSMFRYAVICRRSGRRTQSPPRPSASAP